MASCSGWLRSTASPVELGRLPELSVVSVWPDVGGGEVGLCVLEFDLDRLNPPRDKRRPVVDDDRTELPFTLDGSASTAILDDFE